MFIIFKIFFLTGSVKIEIKPVDPGSATLVGDSDLEEEAEEVRAQYRDSNWPGNKRREPFKPLMDPEVVQEFLLGEYCLHGGTGWWSFEFCYGKKVDQYHQEKGGKKTIINLGTFDEDDHLDWIVHNPSKRPKPKESRKFVSHFYSEGDICDVTGEKITNFKDLYREVVLCIDLMVARVV